MKMVCENSVLDLGKINDYKPDGENVYCKFDIATHKIATVSEKDYGTFIKTEDGGIIYFSDIVFKMLMDLSIKAQLESTKYIKNEFCRANKRDESEQFVIARPDAKTPVGILLNQHGIKNILLPDVSRVISGNLKAFSEYDMINAMCACLMHFTEDYNKACVEIVYFLNDFIYFGKGSKNFMYLHKALTEMFSTFGVEEVKDFIENFYLHLDKIPNMRYNSNMTGTLGVKSASTTSVISDSNAENSNNDSEKENNNSESVNNTYAYDNLMLSVARNNNEFRRIKGEDITGFDETYAIGYCEAFYEKDLTKADSDGFLNQTIISRVNGKAAPIDLLSEAITKEHSTETTVTTLRKNISQLRQDIEASTQMAEAAGE